jgi:hypothetical protein
VLTRACSKKSQDAYVADDHGCLCIHRLYVILSVYETGCWGCLRLQLDSLCKFSFAIGYFFLEIPKDYLMGCDTFFFFFFLSHLFKL